MTELIYEDIVSTKPDDSYSLDQLKNIKLLSVSKQLPASPFGSATYRVQKYPGDLDLHEIFIDCCSMKEVINKFEKVLVTTVRNIQKQPIHYVLEIKAGLDNRYDVNIGTLKNGIFNIKRKNIEDKTIELAKQNLFNSKEVNIISDILQKQNVNENDYDVLYYIFRERKVLRWTYSEIIKKYKMLPGNKKITLNKALYSKAHVKIDAVALINNKFVEITNFFILVYQDRNKKLHMINLDYNFLDRVQSKQNYNKQIKIEIEKLYYSNMFYNPFKMAKRIWALARANNERNTVLTLLPVVTGNISALYQIKSEIDAILRIMTEVKSYAYQTIRKQIDQFKGRLANIVEIDEFTLGTLFNLIDNFLKTKSDKVMLIKKIKNIIQEFINVWTIIELNKIGYNPPPKKYLPMYLMYEQIIRHPYEIVRNPLKFYEA